MVDQYQLAIQNVGKYGIGIALLLWGMTAARRRGQRPGANSPALQSLMLALGAWVVMLLEAAFAPMLAWQVTLVAIAVVCIVGLYAAGAGVYGLSRVRRAGGGALPAAGGIVIGLGLAAVMAWGTTTGYLGARGGATASAQVKPRPPAVLTDFGLSVGPPGDWEPVDPEKMNPNARLAYVRVNPTMGFFIMAETAPSGHTFEIPQLINYVRTSLGVTESTAAQQDRRPVAGQAGTQLGFDAAGPERQFHYRVWLWTSGRKAIIAMVSAEAAHTTPAEVAAEADRVFATISLSESGAAAN